MAKPTKGCSMIARSNRMFVRVVEIGECDEKGKTLLGFQFKGKQIGEVDRHLATVVLPFIGGVLSMAHWSSTEARDRDLAEFLAYIEDIRKQAGVEAGESSVTAIENDGEAD